MVLYDEGNLTWVFLFIYFTLKWPKKSKFEIRKKLVSRLILGFRPVFCAFGARVFF
jgi:hypothetical protein